MYDLIEHGKSLGYINDTEGYIEAARKLEGNLSLMAFKQGWDKGRIEYLTDRINSALEQFNEGRAENAQRILANTKL